MWVKQILDDERLEKLERQVNDLLLRRLPKNLLKQRLVCAVDFTDILYHGKHQDDDDRVRRGRAKSGTTHFHSFGTLTVLKHHKRYTIAITLFRKSDKAHDGLTRLLKRTEEVGLHIKRLYLDRGFDTNACVALLQSQSFPSLPSVSGAKPVARKRCVPVAPATRPPFSARAGPMTMRASLFGSWSSTARVATGGIASGILPISSLGIGACPLIRSMRNIVPALVSKPLIV